MRDLRRFECNRCGSCIVRSLMYAGISEESKLCFCKLIEKLQKHLSALHFSAFQGRKVNFSRYPPWGTERLYQSQVVCVCVSLFYVIDTVQCAFYSLIISIFALLDVWEFDTLGFLELSEIR